MSRPSHMREPAPSRAAGPRQAPACLAGAECVRALLGIADIAIVALSCVLHLWLSLSLPPNLTLHDVGDVAYIAQNHLCHGHYGYIQYLMEHRALPDFDPRGMWCYYNPPLFHIVVAALAGVACSLGATFVGSLWLATFVSAVCVCVTTVVTRRLLMRLAGLAHERGAGLSVDVCCLVALALVAFHPTMSWLSFTGNNDAMSIMFMVIAVERCVAWRTHVGEVARRHDARTEATRVGMSLASVATPDEAARLPREREGRFDRRGLAVIVQVALALGLGMATKVSAFLVAPGIAWVFVGWLAHEWRRGTHMRLVRPFAAFLAVSIAIGMAFPVYNLVRWGIPFSYVQYDDQAAAVSADAGLLERVGVPDAEKFVELHLNNLDTSREANIWAQTLKSSLFDEYYVPETAETTRAMRVLVGLALALSVACLALGAYGGVSDAVLPGWARGLLGVNVLAILAFYVRFCLTMPAVCTMNFRYIVSAFVFAVALAASGMGCLASRAGIAGRVARIAGVVLAVAVAVFCVDGVWLYLTHLLA